MEKKIEKKIENGEVGENGKIGERANNRLRSACDGLSPKKRLVVVILLFVVFAVLAVYMAIDAIKFDDIRRRLPEVEHIKQLDVPKPNNESMNPLIFNSDDDDE
jgi:hypothetical protein